MAKVYSTPGVYIEEKSAFPNSAVAVPTAIPAFVGYTQKAQSGKKGLANVPTLISSYGEFLNYFGGGPKTTFSLEIEKEISIEYKLNIDKETNYILHACIRLFFSNGGSNCYIVSIGQYEGDKHDGIEKVALLDGIDTLKEYEPTMLVIPDAMLLEKEDCFEVQQKMLAHCGNDTRNRFAILDVFRGWLDRSLENDPEPINDFREKIGNNFLQWGAAYYPWIESTAIQANEVDINNISNIDTLKTLLNNEVQINLENINQKRADEIKKLIDQIEIPLEKNNNIKTIHHHALLAVSPVYKDVLSNIKSNLNRLPPSAAMAGIYSMVDNNVGVFQSPANVSMGSVNKPSVNITSEDQEDLNLPLNGKAINAIRPFPGKGVLVWGARTLDGNSGDWRYISVRRTVIMFEQSIKAAAEAYVFAPNTASTWTNLNALITNFLTNQWQNGALAGARAADAFSVDVGLGVTMTPQDILDGMMKITVKVAVTRPAEFIVITFQQQMQQS